MIRYCQESHRMWDGETDLTRCGPYTFNFTESGFFALVDARGEPLYNKAFPFFTKATSHLLWVLIWMALFFGITFFTSWHGPWRYAFPLLMLFHGALFVVRMIQLISVRGLKPLLKPPHWVKVTRRLQQGKKLDYLVDEKLDHHPGMLANLAMIEALRKDPEASKTAILSALEKCPDHVALKALYHHLASRNFQFDSEAMPS